MKRCTEVLQNIKPLKLYAWEKVVSHRVEDARRRQLNFMMKAAVLKALTSICCIGYIEYCIVIEMMFAALV